MLTGVELGRINARAQRRKRRKAFLLAPLRLCALALISGISAGKWRRRAFRAESGIEFELEGEISQVDRKVPGALISFVAIFCKHPGNDSIEFRGNTRTELR